MTERNHPKAADTGRAIVIIGILFFVFGFVTWLGSVLIPYLRIACQLTNFESYLVTFAFYISYLVMALPAAGVLKITGFKKGMAAGLLIMALGTLLFIPAALSRTYGLFLAGLFVQGTGLSILQSASNPYITILGPRESAARRISIMGICNGVAGIIAPIVLGMMVLQDADALQGNLKTMSTAARETALDGLAHKVIGPYGLMAAVLAILAVVIYFSSLPEVDAEEEATTGGELPEKNSIFRFSHLLLGVVALFLYVGVEVIAADTIISYGASQGIVLSTAKFFTSLTLSGMLVGYLVGIICIPRYISQRQALVISSFLGIAFALAALFLENTVSVFFIAMLGIANSLMWPSIWPLAIHGLGRFTRIGSSMLVMAIGGGAVIPLLYGYLADAWSPGKAYWILIPCYVFITFYALKGYRAGMPAREKA
ncbi:sugar MFS transporter [Chitinophaga sp. GCM10012297]|uniref:Sugar MFS transporter n=1 Tax=Chitinophaga chungangae TaxID=2821488 RepID=A0ABS3YG02_9BACT|nr:sugar MFS transporter [Chitinophaga chungangae]MBO9153613.1 sugar MFS transporter [Chitinophaga chungangae]